MDLKLFGERLRQMRIGKGLSIEKLEKEINIPKATISRYENGQREPVVSYAKSLADYFGVNMMWLLGYENKKEGGN